jgi:hypothetical protein
LYWDGLAPSIPTLNQPMLPEHGQKVRAQVRKFAVRAAIKIGTIRNEEAMILSVHNERNDAYGMALSASRHLAFGGYRLCLNSIMEI